MIYLVYCCLVFLSYIHGDCEIFSVRNNCLLDAQDRSASILCLSCNIEEMLVIDQANQTCSQISNVRCVNLFFNTTNSYRNFMNKYYYLINQIFYIDNDLYLNKKNALYVHIEYGILERFSFEFFEFLDRIENRTYHSISFEFRQRNISSQLYLDKNLVNMTLIFLQINIYCQPKGLYQYEYELSDKLKSSLKCHIQKTSKGAFVVILIVTSITVPCLIFLLFLYILCKRKKRVVSPRESMSSESTSSNESNLSLTSM